MFGQMAEPAEVAHPYYPLGVDIPHYAANTLPLPVILGSLVGMLGSAMLATSTLALRFNPSLGKGQLVIFCWFIVCYFVLNHATVASSQNLFAQLWKEYALSDSRYLTSDPFMLSVESITVFLWGPLSFLCAVSIVAASPLRHPLQIIMCMAHLYGVALYYSTSLVETHFTGRSHSRPEFLYFWVYYVGFNFPWVVVPAFLMYDSLKTISRKLRSFEQVKIGLKGYEARNGSAKTAVVSKKAEKKEQ
ncbi:hypothetical protein PFICI_07996 [Pestalotiopsis fici W106-1]|uniref:EXPERA domain-containing protein n=1 Tax=Pestalotiopsis fici (strain W106-1 / CGMCC3.15140) TaxID=1229662 RepID=W3X4Y2_PESFW|nr:uncharacterized protein PFICI_07996 [Pestalotiopsis fici W106-1]ETS80467.1 hypothetical protein PFICI_07996 [Pestalotiopsis fici W106-1]